MSLTSTTQTTETTLPSWFSGAQQNAATAAQSALTAAQSPENQTARTNVLSQYGDATSATNPFTQASTNLGNIQQGLLSTYDPQGNLNVSSPLGALFTAQEAKLNQILPQVTAKEGAVGLGGGNFGSLRGQTATGAARAGALTTMQEAQRKAALDAYNMATQAAQAQGNVGAQGVTSGINLARLQTEQPLDVMAKYENILGAMGPTLNKISTATTEGSTLENIQRLGNFLAQSGMAADQIQRAFKGQSGVGWLDRLFGPSSQGGIVPPEYTEMPSTGPATDYTNIPAQTYSPPLAVELPDGSTIYQQNNGTYTDQSGSPVNSDGSAVEYDTYW